MRHPCTTPCLAPYDVPAKERRRHVCRLAGCVPIPTGHVLDGVKGLCMSQYACTKGKTILDLDTYSLCTG